MPWPLAPLFWVQVWLGYHTLPVHPGALQGDLLLSVYPILPYFCPFHFSLNICITGCTSLQLRICNGATGSRTRTCHIGGGLIALPVELWLRSPEGLLFPLFNSLEPVLYQEVKPEYIKNSLQIIKDNKYLADGKLLELFYNCSQYPTQQNFNQLCSYIDKLYDKTCRRLGLRVRSFSYRIARHQYKHWSYILFYAIALSILQLIVLIALLFVFLCITDYLYLIYENVNDLNKLLMQLFMMIFVFALLKYLQKHF